ncbi:filamentous hemagglutinin N-terminal domain-containing protein [Variovorax sp. ZS18.2.2]|uniref:two-partner secretion domain-containing protein n=1 Tax=Variovorax sp. ZS18.2.2 TaxID=2971255 RepID=UPI002150DB12|nr:filamentous hemagglutinin N-terminal domain-containing protein [Variovorax sp. ZS18.2.2]MCR6478589.1 filamentous hemagglutinin N-terminal domain-containing protein [Variovorax sp. ZS18.2.2]
MKQRNLSRQRPRHHRGLQLRPLAISLLCAGLSPAIAQVLPMGFLPIAGGVTMTQSGAVMSINQPLARGIANWQSFSIGPGGVVNIVQPGATSVLLNRVTGNELSTIAGTLTANGRVILINPNGVMFSQGATVNVGGLIASTLALTTSNQSFMDGATKLTFERPDANSASVHNLGNITATGGGPVVLMGAVVGNGSTGSITADNGTVALASGRKITLDLVGDGLTNIVIAPDAMATHAAVDNSGTIQADGGRVALIGSSVTVGELVVNQTGTVRARSIGTRNGEIVLGGGQDNQVAMTGGTLDATGAAAGERGGNIRIAAGQVQLQATSGGKQALVDASGQAGGGTVAVSGYDVALSSGSVLRASATGQGAGGTIDVGTATGQVLVDGLTAPARESHAQVFGELSARGAGSGKGGTITTKADGLRIGAARVDAGGGANGGLNGSWRIDTPTGNIDVVNSADVPAYQADYPGIASGATVDAGSIGNALGRGTDVTLASGAIGDQRGVRFGENVQVVKQEGGTATLRVDSAGSIFMDSGSAIVSKQGALNVDFNADSTGAIAARAADPAQISVSGGDPNFETDYAGAIRLVGANIDANGGNIRFFGQGDAQNGRAVGGSSSDSDGQWLEGIYLSESTLATNAGGIVSLRGQGRSWVATDDGGNPRFVSSEGIALWYSTLKAGGTGTVSLDGTGGVGGSGVNVAYGSTITATGGDVTLTGRGTDWTADMPVGSNFGQTGVSVSTNATIDAGGDVRIDGAGGNTDAMRQSLAFAREGGFAGASSGVFIGGSITAGNGRRIDITGKGGGDGFGADLDANGNIVITPDGSRGWGVQVSSEGGGTPALRTAGGTVAIDGQGTDVSLRVNSFSNFRALDAGLAADEPPTDALVSVASSTGKGGSISVRGRNVLVDGVSFSEGGSLVARLDASGATGGGSIDIAATGAIAIGATASLEANATGTGTGNGGSVRVVAGDALRAYGTFSARGGAAGGNGGFVETSGAQFDMAGVRVDASAPVGSVGSWLIDPFDVDIVSGVAAGSLTGNPFDPIATSTIQDGDINAALNAGTSVTIGTGTTGSPFLGDIHMSNAKGAVNINYSTNKGAVTFQLDANRSVRADAGTVIQSTGTGALNVVFNADVNNGGTATGGGQISYSGDIYTNGGNVVMNGSWANPSNQGVSVHLDGNEIDTRVGRSDAGAGGSVTIVGKSIGPSGIGDAAVSIDGVHIATSTGNVNITGTAEAASGVRLGSRFVGTGIANRQTEITSTTGNITVLGVGNSVTSAGTSPGHGVIIDQSALRSIDGDITVRGLRQAGGNIVGDGVRLTTGAQVVTSGTGDIELSGQSVGNGAGVRVGPQAPLGGAVPPVLADVIVSAGGNTVLRAGNDGSTDALVIDGKVSAVNVINLRPGGVDAAGNGLDQTATPITLGGTAATGFAVSAAEFGRLTAATIVAGSNAHAANIDVVGPLTLPSALTLQNGGGGNIQLGGAVTATRLGLLSAGNITQVAGAPITAGTLMARSTGGSVLLDTAPNNVSAATVGGGAAGAFRYVDVDTVQLGSVSVTGFDAAGNAPQVQSATSMAADTVFVRTLSGDLLLGTNVSSTSGTDLVAASRFQNLGAYTITGAPWRVWADTWVGETRGGLFGSGPLPNLYHCAYLGLCTVTVSPGDNHFIYAQQPVATVVIGNATRPEGQANPPFPYSVGGLILGDTDSSFSGAPGTSATPGSPPGVYAINGSFASAAGYAVNVRPGDLTVTAAPPPPPPPPPPPVVLRLPDFPLPDLVREVPSTWLYDRNIGPPPICFATGPLEGDRASQGGDVLAREWSRVRSRPNLSSCVDTEKRNGCADF